VRSMDSIIDELATEAAEATLDAAPPLVAWKDIRGLSLTRPWPFAFVNGPESLQKRVENRSWRPPKWILNKHVALHAAKSWNEEDRAYISAVLGMEVPNKKDSPDSEIFAVCRVVGWATRASDGRLTDEQRRWFFGPFGWLVDSLVKLVEPVPCKGALSLWSFSDKQAELEQLRDVYKRSAIPPGIN
jgi:hypothetical protein